MLETIGKALSGLLFVFLLGACTSTMGGPATPSVTTRYSHDYDFSRVHKIAIQPISRTSVATIQISDTQISRINEVLTAELGQRGFTVVHSNAEADMFLSWHLATEAKMDVNDLNSADQYNCLNCGTGDSAQDPKYITATFVVEMIDPLRLQSEWRSTLVTRLLNGSEPRLTEEDRQVAAAKILADFPPNASAP